ncbi:hypothetical protein LCGC14_1524500, partial [marine sediment metagenome]
YKIKRYIQISFRYTGKIMRIYAHRLIWIYFNGNIPKGLEINHKQGIKGDNRLSKLELTSHKENIHHAYKTGLANSTGENHGMHKLTEKKVLKVKRLLKEGTTQQKIAEMFDVSRMTITDINTGRTWSHVVE